MEKTKSSAQVFFEWFLETHACSDEGISRIKYFLARNEVEIENAYFDGYLDGKKGQDRIEYFKKNFEKFSPFEEKPQTLKEMNRDIIRERIELERAEIEERIKKSLSDLFDGILKELKRK